MVVPECISKSTLSVVFWDLGGKYKSSPLVYHQPAVAAPVANMHPQLLSINGHRHKKEDTTRFEMLLDWGGGSQYWVDEDHVHQTAEATLLAYWKSLKGGREGAMAVGKKDLWHVLRIESHRKENDKLYYEVSWVGSDERTWEPESLLKAHSLHILEEYKQTKMTHQYSLRPRKKLKDW